jgi:hypothetical protein
MAMIDDLINRVGNLIDLKLRAYTDADGMFYGGTPAVWRLIKGARDACDDGNFALCERICDVAERKVASEARKFKNKTQAQRMQHAEESNNPSTYRGCWGRTRKARPATAQPKRTRQ